MTSTAASTFVYVTYCDHGGANRDRAFDIRDRDRQRRHVDQRRRADADDRACRDLNPRHQRLKPNTETARPLGTASNPYQPIWSGTHMLLAKWRFWASRTLSFHCLH